MECVRFRFLLLVVLLTYLVTATTVFGNGMIEENDETKRVDHKEVMRRNKWQWGRKIAAVETAGQPGITSEKMLTSVSNMHHKDSKSIRLLKSMTTTASKRTSSDEKPKTKTTIHASHDETKADTLDPQVTGGEVFSMLHRDYETRVRRRPPINNAVPLNTHRNNKP